MSYDFDVRTSVCDHRQSLERYIIDSGDFRTLKLAADTSRRMRAPINGLDLVEISIGGTLVAPDHPVYGYTFLPDENMINTPDRFMKIVFKHPVRFVIPLIEVTYLTYKPYCLKCSGTGQLNDLQGAKSGSLLHVFDLNKLIQRSLKFILTSQCPFYPALTCPIKDYIGKKFGVIVTEADIANGILNALSQMKKIQGVQRTVQTMTALEMLKDITSVTAVQEDLDPTIVNVGVKVSSYGSATTSPIAFSIRTTK